MKGCFLILFLFQFCASQKHETKATDKMPYCWLNVEYIECLKSKLPCECEKDLETYYSLVIDTNSMSKNFGVALSGYGLIEPNIYPIKKVGIDLYEVISNKKDGAIWAKLLIKEDSVCLIENRKQLVFCNMCSSTGYNTQHYLRTNIDLLNKSFAQRGYSTIEEIVGDDSLIFECNKWKGNVNILSVLGKSKSWILKISNDSLFIDLVTYPSDDPDPDDPIIPKKFKTFKWK